jgi:hypothetical protein
MRPRATLSRSVLIPALLLTLATAVQLAVPHAADAMTSHAGWPEINGKLLMNKGDAARPLDGRPGKDPFDWEDGTYSCDGVHVDASCVGQPDHCVFHDTCRSDVVVPHRARHNELLGAHGDDTIHAGPYGDVIWGDYKAPADGDTAQPSDQRDHLYGGAGRDFIYASHGRNVTPTGGGPEVVHAHFRHGSITCDGGDVTVFLSRQSLRRYELHGCRRISFATKGY